MLLRSFILLCLVLFMNFSGNLYYHNEGLSKAFKERNSLLLKNITYFKLDKSNIELEYISNNNIKHYFKGNLIKNEDRDLSLSFNGKTLYIENYSGNEDQHTLLLKTEKYLLSILKMEQNYLYESPVYFVSSEDINIPKELIPDAFVIFFKFIIAILFGYAVSDLIKLIYFEYKVRQEQKREKFNSEKNKTKQVISLSEVFSGSKEEISLYNRNFQEQEKDNIIKKIKGKINNTVYSENLKQRIFNELSILEKAFEKDKTIVLKKLIGIEKELENILIEKQKENEELVKKQTDEASENLSKLFSLLKK